MPCLMLYVIACLLQHLFTCDLDGKEMRSVADCVQRLKLLDGMGRVWGQNMLMEVRGANLLLTDIETKVTPKYLMGMVSSVYTRYEGSLNHHENGNHVNYMLWSSLSPDLNSVRQCFPSPPSSKHFYTVNNDLRIERLEIDLIPT